LLNDDDYDVETYDVAMMMMMMAAVVGRDVSLKDGKDWMSKADVTAVVVVVEASYDDDDGDDDVDVASSWPYQPHVVLVVVALVVVVVVVVPGKHVVEVHVDVIVTVETSSNY
jgi:hypothetical protein